MKNTDGHLYYLGISTFGNYKYLRDLDNVVLIVIYNCLENF